MTSQLGPTLYMESKNLSSKWIPYISANCATHPWLTQNINWCISVATDEGPSPKLALSEGGSRGNIES